MNRIYIEYPAGMTEKNIKFMESILSEIFHNRTVLDDFRAFIDLSSNENPDLDEVSEFILELDETEFSTFWGFPLEDDSNITSNIDFKDIFISEV